MSVEMVIDAFIVAMPIYEISKLQMRTGKKIGIASVFGVGLFVIVTGVIRVILTYTSNPVTLDMYSDVVWYNVNDGAAFLGACMPTYLPMLVFLRKKVSQYGSSIRGRISSGSARSDTRHAVELKEPGSSRDRNGDIKANDGESEVYMLSMTSSRRASSQQ
ncbi:MAG: hypothetical protein M1820_001877 [Bogoriella megaspora]|nr:MAG: hypothetical protein M1820_001877 [Bogoriella megaspora]